MIGFARYWLKAELDDKWSHKATRHWLLRQEMHLTVLWSHTPPDIGYSISHERLHLGPIPAKIGQYDRYSLAQIWRHFLYSNALLSLIAVKLYLVRIAPHFLPVMNSTCHLYPLVNFKTILSILDNNFKTSSPSVLTERWRLIGMGHSVLEQMESATHGHM